MKLSTVILAFTLVTASCFALPATGYRHVLFQRLATPEGFRRIEASPKDTKVEFHVALKEANKNVINLLDEVSDIEHENYGKYLSVEELRDMTKSSPRVQRKAEKFFSSIDCTNVNGASLRCVATVEKVEALFQTKMFRFKHENSGIIIDRHVGHISIPMEMEDAVEFVTGLGSFVLPSLMRRQSLKEKLYRHTSSDDDCSGADCYVVPETIRNIYNVSKENAAGDASSQQGVGEFAGNFGERDSDLATFGKNVGAAKPLKVDKRGGAPNDPNQVSVETTLDIQYVSALGGLNTNWIWNADGWMYEFCTELQGAKDRPDVISMSYAWSESQQCGGVTHAECQKLGVNATQYVLRTNQEFAKLGLLGITMLSASGDSGCHGRTEESCLFRKEMNPDYPASSPYILSVGGTVLSSATTKSPEAPVCKSSGQLNGQCATDGTEVVSSTDAGSRISSGGGFALYSQRPAYQEAFVAKYLSNATVASFAGGNGTLFNVNGRGYPDIAALAHKFYIENGGAVSSVDGTSAASPTIAGLVGLINAHRLKRGRKVVGFINPLLYKIWTYTNGEAFNDITVGSNACTEQGCSCKTGFLAAPGWDASTGLGTPNYGLLLNALDELDSLREQKFMAKRQ